MPSLAELTTERRTKLKQFADDIYDQSASFDVSQLNEWIAEAPITSKQDAFAALDIVLEQIDSEQALAVSMVSALRKFLDVKMK